MNRHLHRLLPIVLGIVLAGLALPAVAQTPPAAAANNDLPPINCPLRKAGVDPNQLRPFEEVAEYIAFLDTPERTRWQKPDEVVTALGLAGDETVVDLGAGGGYFTFRLARALPDGRVIASDIEPEMIRHIHRTAKTEGVGHIQVELVKPDDPLLPDDADLVFVCDVLLHVQDRPGWTKRLAGEMRTGARLALIEFREGDLPEGPPKSKKIPKKAIIELFTTAGLILKTEHPDLLPYQVFLVFEKP